MQRGFFRKRFREFPYPAWAVASCSSGPQAALKLFRKTSLHDGMGNSVVPTAIIRGEQSTREIPLSPTNVNCKPVSLWQLVLSRQLFQQTLSAVGSIKGEMPSPAKLQFGRTFLPFFLPLRQV